MAMRPLKVSINRSLIDKEEPRNKLAYSHDWEAFELSIEELGAAVQKGWAYGPRWNGTRNRANFCCSDIAVVDIDNAPSLDEILSREPIREHAALVHTTSSHTAEHARARAIFVLPETILRGDEFAATNLSLALRCGGDLSPTSAATGFFGFREADVRIAHRELPAELVRELIAQSFPAIKTRRSSGAGTVDRDSPPTADLQVKCADGRLVHVSDLNPRVPLHCPYHDDRHASAFTVQNRHGVTGIHCSTCQTTYWPERSETAYDFNDFEAHVVRARDYFERHRDWGPLLSDPDHVIEGLTDCSVSIVDRFATPNSRPRRHTDQEPKRDSVRHAVSRTSYRGRPRSAYRSPPNADPAHLRAARPRSLPRPRG